MTVLDRDTSSPTPSGAPSGAPSGPGAFEPRLPAAVLLELQERVRARLAADGLDAVVSDDPEDVAYLTGFFHHPCERPVAVWLDTDGATLLLPELEREHAEAQHAQARLAVYGEFPGERSPWLALADAVGPAVSGLTVGLGPAISQRRWTGLRTAVRVADWVPTELLGEVRAVKHPAELALHREAARITDVMLDAGLELVREGLANGSLPSEAELASHVGKVGTATMYGEHADVVVVSPLAGGLVYAGANSAHPHGLPSAYRLRPGDTFMLSLGCAVGGRFVEGERTYVLGRPTDDQRRYHDTVRRAQALGAQVLRPGVTCEEANRRCLAVIEDAGLGQFLRHRQGHGIGLGMHEPPWLAPGDDTPLAAGMVVSNEPGLYVPGHAGYRISDSMLVTETGAEPLTSHPRDLDSCVVEL
ncbi:Xaa-Pro aminopeptidase [Microlunatus sagamiharensis]|uniref:Xaa-Pro aminopeptidase n=1 Tax=Microlunatus sagamiharensis TaxID=546874 RepID=A0A1H2MIR3_9ACTN|nr:Xaa-Pro peptidase family protein [Microlunatus sagamiharensis]SDU93069.1 Xaa-Pro aminopeptidase [Microlunatus sagamiharensis]